MLKGISSSSHTWGQNLSFILLFGLAYPFAIIAEALKRALAPVETKPARGSLLVEARETTSIAISFAVMAKATLRRSSR